MFVSGIIASHRITSLYLICNITSCNIYHLSSLICSLNITADQYTIVGEHLIASVAEVLGPALDDKTAQAWIAAYAQLANILIGAEAKLYQDAAKIHGGWNGWRKFTVHQKVS